MKECDLNEGFYKEIELEYAKELLEDFYEDYEREM